MFRRITLSIRGLTSPVSAVVTLGAHARGLLCRPVSVPALAASASVYVRKQRHTLVSLRLFLDFDS